jgi:dihydrofolate reductase
MYRQLSANQSDTMLVDSFEKAVDVAGSLEHGRVFVIGGAQMYNLAINNKDCSHIVLTRVKSKVNCDTFFPTIEESQYRLASHQELEEYVESAVPEGIQKHKELEYEFTLFVRR